MRTLPLWLALAACSSSPPVQPDAASTTDAAFPCNRTGCDKATQYCYEVAAGFAPALGCNALPPACAAQPTCACITPTITGCASGLVGCSEHDGAVTATCNLP